VTQWSLVVKFKAKFLHMVSLQRRLITIAFAGIVPLALVAGLGLGFLVHDQKLQAQQRALEVTRLAATTIEIELKRSLTTMQALAQSPLLEQKDLNAYEDLVGRVLPLLPSWYAVLIASPDGEILKRISPHNRAPGGPIAETESFAEVVRTRQAVIGQLGIGPSGRLAIPLRLPIIRNGQLKYILTVVLKPEAIRDVRNTRILPEGWIGSVFDSHNLRIARTSLHEQTLGQPASDSLTRVFQQPGLEGIGQSSTVEGKQVYTAFVRLPESGWIVTTAIPTSEVIGAAVRSFAIYGGGLTLSLLLAFLAASRASDRISKPIRELQEAAHALGQKQPLQMPSSTIQEIQDVGRALIEASASRLHSEAERENYLANLQRVQKELTQQVTDLEIIQKLNQQLLQLPSLEEQMQAILKALCLFHNTPYGHVSLGRGGETLRLFTSQGLSTSAVNALAVVEPGQGACGTAVNEKRRVIVKDIEKDPRCTAFVQLAHQEGFSAIHSTPLYSETYGIIGALTVQLTETREPTEREVRLADICASKAVVFIDRARMQDAALQSEQRLHIALDSSMISFGIANNACQERAEPMVQWEYLNPMGASMLGQPNGHEDGKARYHWAQPRIFDICHDVMVRGSASEHEIQGTGPYEDCWLHIVATPFKDNVAVWFVDISQRKQQEKLLQDADRQKDAFLAVLAHELRNPLAPIRQAAALIGTRGITEAQRTRSYEVIDRQVTHMGLLLDDLLDVSRITHGKVELNKQTVALQSLVMAAIDATQALLQAKHHRLDVQLPNDTVSIEADPLRLEQILTNLLVNAAKYTNEGGEIDVIVSVLDETADIVVVDNGIGIAKEDQEAIFTMFAQVNTGVVKGAGGLGIGLALARELARLHGGDIHVQSPGVGQGSRFVVTLPLGLPQTLSGTPAANNVQSTGTHRRVLVADDNVDIAETMAELLRLEGHEVYLAFDGNDALVQYQRYLPEVVLLDIGMPGMTGHQVAQAIRALPNGTIPRLIAITGWGQGHDREQAISAGFDHHLTKPANIELVYSLVEG
jgi:CheY-like chemotaxis protein